MIEEKIKYHCTECGSNREFPAKPENCWNPECPSYKPKFNLIASLGKWLDPGNLHFEDDEWRWMIKELLRIQKEAGKDGVIVGLTKSDIAGIKEIFNVLVTPSNVEFAKSILAKLEKVK